jgi:hypothetical protein
MSSWAAILTMHACASGFGHVLLTHAHKPLDKWLKHSKEVRKKPACFKEANEQQGILIASLERTAWNASSWVRRCCIQNYRVIPVKKRVTEPVCRRETSYRVCTSQAVDVLHVKVFSFHHSL